MNWCHVKKESNCHNHLVRRNVEKKGFKSGSGSLQCLLSSNAPLSLSPAILRLGLLLLDFYFFKNCRWTPTSCLKVQCLSQREGAHCSLLVITIQLHCNKKCVFKVYLENLRNNNTSWLHTGANKVNTNSICLKYPLIYNFKTIVVGGGNLSLLF